VAQELSPKSKYASLLNEGKSKIKQHKQSLEKWLETAVDRRAPATAHKAKQLQRKKLLVRRPRNQRAGASFGRGNERRKNTDAENISGGNRSRTWPAS
jgi:hypothetical protein